MSPSYKFSLEPSVALFIFSRFPTIHHKLPMLSMFPSPLIYAAWAATVAYSVVPPVLPVTTLDGMMFLLLLCFGVVLPLY